MRNIIYIINPISGTRTKKDLQSFIEQQTKKKKISFRVFPSVASGDYSFLVPIIQEEKITDVVIAGGDGTVNQVLAGLMHCDVNFGIIPCGSGNGLALAAKIPRQPAKALEVVFNGKAIATDGFYINERFSCMLSGLGFDAKVAHDFAAQPKRGLMTYIKQVAKNFFKTKTYAFELSVGQQQLKLEAYFISIANSNQFGNNFTIAPKASLSDGLLDIVIVCRQHKVSMVLQTLKQLSGRNKPQSTTVPIKRKAVIYLQAEKLTIKNLSRALLHIDGETADIPEEVKVAIKKKCFRLIQPS